MEDRLTRSPGSADELQLQILGQIRDNLSAINRKQDSVDQKLDQVNVRVVRLEERDERLERAEKAIEKMDGKLDALLRDKDQRDGAGQVFVGIRGWAPVIIAIGAAVASIFSAVYLSGRATGVINPPSGYIAPQHPSGERR
jgi:septal ring factor EnvC (AmiA/AmiB activator)